MRLRRILTELAFVALLILVVIFVIGYVFPAVAWLITSFFTLGANWVAGLQAHDPMSIFIAFVILGTAGTLAFLRVTRR